MEAIQLLIALLTASPLTTNSTAAFTPATTVPTASAADSTYNAARGIYIHGTNKESR